MKLKLIILSLCTLSNFLFAAVENSIVPLMDELVVKDLNGKINQRQIEEIGNLSTLSDLRLRVLSFNMLLNWSEAHLEPVDRWESRKDRVIEYIQWASPDVIGSQELQADQLDDILSVIGGDYGYYGVGTKDGKRAGDIPAIFYRKGRLEFIQGETFYFSKEGSSSNKNTFTLCHFKDKQTKCEFIAINTHLAFGNMERRYDEACALRDFLCRKQFRLPFFITGDFNTFPFRQELDLPFYDGEMVVQIIERGGVSDSMRSPLLGHFGPLSSTNFCSEKKKPFCSEGDPGIILDHIFVSKKIRVLAHGIDPAKVDEHYPSDHFPVIADILFF